MVTIKDIAKEAGVSIATASRALNDAPHTSEATKIAVKKAVEKLGYRPNANARALVSKASNAIGVLVNDLSSPFFGTMIKAIDSVAHEQKRQLLIGSGYHDELKERDAINLLLDSRCESLVIHSKGLADQELIHLAEDIPGMVFINRMIPEIASRCIALDNRKGAYIATEYLIKNGHRHIGYVCSDHKIDDAEERRAGYLEALKANGIEPREEYIEYGSPDELGGEQATINLISKNLPITAVATYNDDMAAGCLALLQENGVQVPQDISVIGFDDSFVSRYIYPRLTTIRYPIQVMAKEAVQLSIQLANDKNAAKRDGKLFIPTLVRRASVSVPKDINTF